MNNSKVSFSVSMLGWALNEEENIAGYIEKAHQFLDSVADDYELIIIDDGSTDRTWEIATQCQESRPWLRLYQNGHNRGSGYNTKRAISLAQKEYLFWQTVDWSYDISQLGRSLALVQNYDVLQGVRVDTSTSRRILRDRSDTPLKALISLVNYWLIRLLFGLPLHDFQNVTVYPRKLIQSVTLETESAFTNPECLLKTWWTGITIKEIPVPFIKRGKGVAKGTRPKQIFKAIGNILYWWFQWTILGKRQVAGRGKIVYWHES